MKRTGKVLLALTGIIIFVILIVIFGSYFWLSNKWKDVVTEEEYNSYVDKVRSAPDLPERFYEIYDIVNKNGHKTTTLKMLLRIPGELLTDKWSDSCPCVEVNYGFVLSTFDRWSVGMKLDKDVGPQKCLDAYLNNLDFLNLAIGVHEASRIYFNKELEDLTDEEMLKLVLMVRNPVMYNPLRNPDALEHVIAEYKDKL